MGDDYLPSDDDVLRARSMTTGIVTFPFEASKLKGKSSLITPVTIRLGTKTGREHLNLSLSTWVDRELNGGSGFTVLRMSPQVIHG